MEVFLCCKWCFSLKLDTDHRITRRCEYVWGKKHSQGMMLSSSELSGSMSFSLAFSVLSLNIRTSSWRRSLTTALVWLAADAGRSFSLKNRHRHLDDATVYSMFVCAYSAYMSSVLCRLDWLGQARTGVLPSSSSSSLWECNLLLFKWTHRHCRFNSETVQLLSSPIKDTDVALVLSPVWNTESNDLTHQVLPQYIMWFELSCPVWMCDGSEIK